MKVRYEDAWRVLAILVAGAAGCGPYEVIVRDSTCCCQAMGTWARPGGGEPPGTTPPGYDIANVRTDAVSVLDLGVAVRSVGPGSSVELTNLGWQLVVRPTMGGPDAQLLLQAGGPFDHVAFQSDDGMGVEAVAVAAANPPHVPSLHRFVVLDGPLIEPPVSFAVKDADTGAPIDAVTAPGEGMGQRGEKPLALGGVANLRIEASWNDGAGTASFVVATADPAGPLVENGVTQPANFYLVDDGTTPGLHVHTEGAVLYGNGERLLELRAATRD